MIDLHTHSTFSDGTMTPTELVREAERLGLSAIALTDHNTVEGLPEFMAAGQGSSVRTVPGVEFSTEYGGTELHILALFVRPEHYAPITEEMEQFRLRKEKSNEELVAALNRAGIAVNYEKIRRESKGYVNRALIGAEMMALGYTSSVQEAFKKYLAPEQGFYVPPRRTDACEMIRFIKSMGLTAVLAHPFLNLNEKQLRAFLPRALACGLDAMETAYPKYDDMTTLLAQVVAEDFGLLPGGGSDFHGTNKPDIAMGTGRNNLQIPRSVLTALETCTNF